MDLLLVVISMEKLMGNSMLNFLTTRNKVNGNRLSLRELAIRDSRASGYSTTGLEDFELGSCF